MTIKTVLLTSVLVLAGVSPAFATWSVIAVDARTGQVIIAGDDSIKKGESANPVKTLRMRYDAWVKSGSSRLTAPPPGLYTGTALWLCRIAVLLAAPESSRKSPAVL